MKKIPNVSVIEKELLNNKFFWIDNAIMLITVFLYFLSFLLNNQSLIIVCLILFFVSAFVHFFIISSLKKSLPNCPRITIVIWQLLLYLIAFFILAIIFRCLGIPLFHELINMLASTFFVLYSLAFFLMNFILLKDNKAG